ncbi:PAS domain-containing hybrid sensor histidine kinase/response regulator [Clostridium sp.]|jgi:two-component system, cell cycle sensor histidine kinase and response regulator CckA|uniref:PAS domain-containing hybrid sensor histidine kinase/response regulator n=1 Tax=Clostridium sp. TaxID=1506 RepID=UPI0039F4DE35
MDNYSICLEFLKNIPVPIIILDSQYKILGITSSGEDLLKRLHITLPELSNLLVKPIENFLSKNLKEYIFEKQFGSTYLQFKVNKISNSTNSINLISIVINDISEKKYIQLALEKSKEQLKLLLNNMPVMIQAFDKEGNMILWNNECERITGYTREEILSAKNPNIILYPDYEYRKSIEDKCKELNYEYKDVESTIICKDGRKKTISWYSTSQSSPISNWFYIKFGVDITFRKVAEKKLREKKIQLETIFKAFPDIYLVFDKNGTFLDCKTKDSDSLISPFDELIGKKVYEIYDNSTGLQFKSAILKALKTKSLVVFEYELPLRKNLQYFEARLIPLSDNEVISIIRNITKRKQSDEELLKMEKLNSIGILAGGIAHDFNNILTIILGNISLMKTYVKPDDKISKKLSDLEKTVFQAKSLTKQLFTFSKDSKPLKKITYINDLIKETTNLALSGSNVACKMYIPNNLWPVEIDCGQMSQVISNLVINAYQAMPNGGFISIRCRNIELSENEIVGLNPGKYICISVKDQGCGISKDNLLKIFDPYFTTKKTGIGLGLASAYSIIKKHNGHILVKSKLDKGSVFKIYLPACEGVPIEIEEPKYGLISGENKILVMDDEIDIRKMLSAMLKHMGYKVVSCKDGLEAIELYKKAMSLGDAFDAVIMDLTIPGGMGGEETIKHLLQVDPKIKAIVSSGYSAGGVISNFKDYGFKGAINKPYTIEELSNELNRVLNSN